MILQAWHFPFTSCQYEPTVLCYPDWISYSKREKKKKRKNEKMQKKGGEKVKKEPRCATDGFSTDFLLR